MKKIISFLKKQKFKKILILSHQNADPDALCGIYVLDSVLSRLLPKKEIKFSCDGLSLLSSHLAEKLNIDLPVEIDNFSPDIVILFDVNNLEHTGKFEKIMDIKTKSIIIIDHHAPPFDIKKYSELSIIDDTAISANEILFNEFDRLGIKLHTKEAFAILIGMLYDSRHFILASSRSFSIVPKLIAYGADYSRAISLLNLPMERPEKIARLKAGQRLKIIEITDWIIVFSHVSAYEASACRGILGMGADVVFVRSVVDEYSCDAVRYFENINVRHMEITSPITYFKKCFIYGKSLNNYSKINNARALTASERLRVFGATSKTNHYSFTKSCLLFFCLMIGAIYYELGRRGA